MPQPKSAHLKFATLLLLAMVVPGIAQSSPGSKPDESGVTLKVKAQLTLVDVTVTDAKGNPVHGLTQSDFTVKEDGKPQPLRNFQEYGTQVTPAQPALPPNVYTNAQPQAPTDSAVNVLLIDDLTTGTAGGLAMAPDNVIREKDHAIAYLKTMPAGTQVAILELTGGLRVVQGLTSDRDLLLAAVNSLVYKPVALSYVTSAATELWGCSAAEVQSQLVMAGLEQSAAFLSGTKGRKNLIWFTPGVPWLTNYPAFSKYPCLIDHTPELQRIYGLLTAAQVSLYPVDPRGLKSCLEASLVPTITGLPCLKALPEDFGSLDDMARATGGAAYYNRNDLDAAVREAIATGGDYYALAYVPPNSKYDGQHHTINVKVDRPGVHLQYREGYTSIDLAKSPKPVAKSPDKNAPRPLSEFQAAMGHGAAPSTQLVFHVHVTPSAKSGGPVMGSVSPALKGKPLVRYDFVFSLPSDQITLEEGSTRKGSLQLTLIAYDGEGKVLSSLSQTGAVAVKPELLAQFLQKPFQVPLQLDLPPGAIFVRIGVRDVKSEKVGTFEIPLTVPKPAAR